MSDTPTCQVDCDGELKARGLCRKHYARSWRRRQKAGVAADEWDWLAGAAQNFTAAARGGRGGVRGSPPPGEHPGETETPAPRTPSLETAVGEAIDRLPEPVRCGWRAAAIRLLAETLEAARWAENTQPSAAGVSQLWGRLSALEEEYTTAEESDAIDELGAVLLAELAAAEGS